MSENNHPPPCRDPFEDTLDAVISGEATERDHIILNDTLRTDPEARATYIRTMAFEAMLAREFAPAEDAAAPAPRRRASWRFPLSVAATIALATGLAWHFQGNHPAVRTFETTDDDQIGRAVITSLQGASGRFGGETLSPGLRLTDGMVELDSGIAEIIFDTGAEVTLEGPARLRLESDGMSRLDAGKASAYVPEQARGFVIHTPTSYIRDLGTAFSLEVSDGAGTELQVLEGEVEVSATGRRASKTPRILRQKEAVRLAGGDMLPISFKPGGTIPRSTRPPPPVPQSVHWSFDSWDGATTRDSSQGHTLDLVKDGRPATPELTEGPFGPAIRLDGEGEYARSDYPGVGGSLARTVACWVCIQPPDERGSAASSGIVSWGANRMSAKWQIALNRAREKGNIGAPRVEFGQGYVIGSTDLRDGRWHHLAVVFFGGPRADVATHVRIYVDAKLETLTGRLQQRIDTDTDSAKAQPLTVGRHMGNRSQQSYEGELDELHVFEGPLLPGQIVRLMKRNSLRPPAN